MSKIVRYELDLNQLPPLTEAQQAELKALAAMPDSDIDCSDIPPLDDAFWKNAVRGRFCKPKPGTIKPKPGTIKPNRAR